MHIPDGFLAAPVYAPLGAGSLAMCGIAAWRAHRSMGEKQVPMLGMAGAFIFAAQMLNFPVAGGTSGHFLGATMASLLLGPLNACLVMALVLTAQCFLFADGGMTALGANVFNMGIVGAIGGGALHALLRAVLPRTRSAFLGAAFVASWASVVAGAAACAVELALSGTVPLLVVLPTMLGVHAIIGIGEGLITCAVLGHVLAARPDLVSAWPQEGKARRAPWVLVAAGLAATFALAWFVAPHASTKPDGLERVAEEKGFSDREARNPDRFSWASLFPGLKNMSRGTALAGVAGAAGIFVAGAGAAWLFTRRRKAA